MKTKTQLLLFVLVASLPLTYGQNENDTIQHWESGGNTGLTFSQVSLSNWSGGGENSISGTFSFNSFLNYTKGKSAWENTLDIGYGLTRQGSENMVKTEDRLQFVSKYGRDASENWLYTALLDFKTQFDKGYKDPPENTILSSRFLAPAYLLLSLGMDYKPNDR
ncbi:MAG: DUF3078 domain-containing protein, partial [Marinilabiliaceae bacterium]